MAVLSGFWQKNGLGPLGVNALAFEIFVQSGNVFNFYFTTV